MGSLAAPPRHLTVGVLALQGAFSEHIQLLRAAGEVVSSQSGVPREWTFLEVRTVPDLQRCDGLIVPGGESTTMSLVAQRSGLLEPLREFVKVSRKPTWGTCAGLILLAESANRTKQGGQELIGGLDVRVNRNHFGRQTESFTTEIALPFLTGSNTASSENDPFKAIFIRAPIVEKILPTIGIGAQLSEVARSSSSSSSSSSHRQSTSPTRIIAPSLAPTTPLSLPSVEVLATLPGRTKNIANAELRQHLLEAVESAGAGDIVAVRQANVFGTSFHPELTGDPRIHVWWLQEVVALVEESGESMN